MKKILLIVAIAFVLLGLLWVLHSNDDSYSYEYCKKYRNALNTVNSGAIDDTDFKENCGKYFNSGNQNTK